MPFVDIDLDETPDRSVNVLPPNPINRQEVTLQGVGDFSWNADLGEWQAISPFEIVFEDQGPFNLGYMRFHNVFFGNVGGPAYALDLRLEEIQFSTNGANSFQDSTYEIRNTGVTQEVINMPLGTGALYTWNSDPNPGVLFTQGDRVQVFLVGAGSGDQNDTWAICKARRIIIP